VPLDETDIELDLDKIDRIVSDVRDEAHLKAGRATKGKYE
jgi:tetrahydromethanopterin S-methyltransferase subunit F